MSIISNTAKFTTTERQSFDTLAQGLLKLPAREGGARNIMANSNWSDAVEADEGFGAEEEPSGVFGAQPPIRGEDAVVATPVVARPARPRSMQGVMGEGE